MNLTIFDVEHGQCSLLTCDNGKRIMIDCGHNANTGWRPGSYLRSLGVNELDLLIITNYDEDHTSGLIDLRKNVSIRSLQRNRGVSPDVIQFLKTEDGMGPGIEELVKMAKDYTADAEPVEYPGVERRVFRLSYPEFEDENNLSLVVYLKLNGIGFLFPGDLETKGWSTLLARDAEFRSVASKINVLVASHHGRENGISEVLFDEHNCNPHWVVISDKGYMYETQETVQYYASKCKGGWFNGETRYVLTTRNDGTITFYFQDGKWGARPGA